MNKKMTSISLFSSIFLGTLAGGMFWTGFPIFFHTYQGANISLASIYVFATIGSLIFSLIGGYLSDIIDFRKISIFSNILSSFLIFLLFLLTSPTKQIYPSFFALFLLPILYFNFALGDASESVWMLKSAGQENLRNRFFDRIILSFAAKLIGFSLGPVLFAQLHNHTLILCVILFFLAASIQIVFILKEKNMISMTKSESNLVKKISIKNLYDLIKNGSLLGSTILTGVLSVPFNVLIASYLIEIARPIDISIFWGLGGSSAILGMFVLRKIKLKNLNRIALIISLGLIFFVCTCFLTKNPILIIFSASCYIFLGTFFNVQVRLQTLENSDFQVIGSSAGMLNFLIDSGVFWGMLLNTSQMLQQHIMLMSVFSLFIVIRCLSFIKLKDTRVISDSKCNEPPFVLELTKK